MKLNPKDGSVMPSLLSVSKTYSIYDPPFTPHDDDSIERITVLGSQEPNPYLIPNMRQAYLDLGYDPNLATITNLYVRFKPTTDQLAALDSTMDAQGLDLFDTPMDYDVTYEGDYYQDPSIPDSLPTWQYAVVPPNFVFPSGVTHETLAQIHIPPDNYTAIETEAENIAGRGLNNVVQANGTVRPYVPQCSPGYHWDYTLLQCVPNNCPPGYLWSGTACVPANCQSGYYFDGTSCVPYNNIPPAPAPDAQIPAGNIFVFDTQITVPPLSSGSNAPVRKARMVARRWFKIERTYTDINGHFQFTKRFKNKVRVIVKFKNDDAQIRNIRGARFWQMLFAVKRELGIFSGDKSNITYIATQFPDYTAKGNIYWAAATVHNSVQEYRDYAANTEHIGLPPQGLKIFISRNGLFGIGGNTPMFAKRVINNIATAFVTSYLSPIVAGVVAVVKSQLDMIIGYRYTTNGNLDITQLLSDRIKETTYHELTHAAHYAALGNTWYTSLVTAEEYENEFGLPAYKPYGDGANTTFSPIIALGESWAYYMGHYLADKTYGVNASCQDEQDNLPGTQWCNNNGTGHPHLDVEENFNPNLTADRFEWIPQGLFYDLRDPANETIVAGNPVNDLVSNYTHQQMFNAFSGSIYTLQDYRVRLLQTTTNPTSGQVTGLFAQYHY